MKKALILLTTIIFITNVNANERETVTLNKCVDGDTAVFTRNNKENIRVRFLAIDTPESVHPIKEVEPFGKNSSEYTCNKLKNSKKIELEFDPKSEEKDKYDRYLAWVWVDDKLIEEDLISVGYAKVKYVYDKYKYVDLLYKVQDKAKSKKLGLWSEYTEQIYNITFIDDDKEIKKQVIENEYVKEPKHQEKDGYIFKGWFYEDKPFDFNIKITSDMTIKAVYEKEISLTEYIIGIIISIVIYALYQVKYIFRKGKYHGKIKG